MRPSLTLLALACCLALWLLGLWLGRPWPVTLALQVPHFGVSTPPDAAMPAPVSRAMAVTALALAPRAGAAITQRPLPCGTTRITVQVTQPFGTRRGLDTVAVGWPEREDGWGVLALDGAPGSGSRAGPAPLTLTGRGLVAAPTLQLTSLGGLFDGTGAVEVTPVCID